MDVADDCKYFSGNMLKIRVWVDGGAVMDSVCTGDVVGAVCDTSGYRGI